MKEVRDLDVQPSGCTAFKAEKSQCKNPEAESYLLCLKNSKGTNVAGELRTKGRVVGDKFRQVMGGR